MMGRLEATQDQLFYDFRFEAFVAADHLVRRIDAALDLTWLRAELKPFYSVEGRPSIDPELMIRMLLLGYCFGIRSERRLCAEVKVNLAYRWFCGLGLDGAVPDHSTFSKNRHGRFRDSDLFRRVFERVVATCIEAGLVEGEAFAVDSSIIDAVASPYKPEDSSEVTFDRTDAKQMTRPVREYLAVLDAANASENPDDWITPQKKIARSDPAAGWTTRGRSQVAFAYATNYLLDTGEAGIIMDVAASPASLKREVDTVPVMIERTDARFGLRPKTLIGDTAYGAGRMVGWLVRNAITPHVPVRESANKGEGIIPESAFSFDTGCDDYTCPEGKRLTSTGHVYNRRISYRASKFDCEMCTLKSNCCPTQPYRKLTRDVDEAARDVARALAGSEAFEHSRRLRKKVEVRFAHLKTIVGLRRLRLRGLSGAHDEMTLAATAQNLRKLARSNITARKRAA
ncbi:MAG: transposase [Hyphomonadaceae bacterium]|nr:transposase [Hyphomonadaceae bacterium]